MHMFIIIIIVVVVVVIIYYFLVLSSISPNIIRGGLHYSCSKGESGGHYLWGDWEWEDNSSPSVSVRVGPHPFMGGVREEEHDWNNRA